MINFDEEALQDYLRGLIPQLGLSWQPIPETDLLGFLLDEEGASAPVPADNFAKVMDSPPFWSLLWPSGNFLCKKLSTRGKLVDGHRVVDLGCGSGLMAVACAKSGASVKAADADPQSIAVTRLNMLKNGVDFPLLRHWHPEPTQILILADFLYDESNLPLLADFKESCEEILVMDCRLDTSPGDGFEFLGEFVGTAVPDLDPHREFGCLRCWYAGHRSAAWVDLVAD